MFITNSPLQIRWGFGGRGSKVSAKSILEVPKFLD